MSIWSDIAGLAVGAGGVIAGVATANPALIAGGVSAAGSIIGAGQAASAAEHGADTQAAAAQQALDFAKQVYGQRRQDLSGQIGLGSGASSRLGQLYGFPMATAPQPTLPYNGQSPFNATGGQNTDPGSVQKYQPIVPGSTSVSPTFAGGTPPTANMGLITVRAPTGETRQVPAGLATFYQGKGATIVQGA